MVMPQGLNEEWDEALEVSASWSKTGSDQNTQQTIAHPVPAHHEGSVPTCAIKEEALPSEMDEPKQLERELWILIET